MNLNRLANGILTRHFLDEPKEIHRISKITNKVLEHDGCWAYEANGTYSESFPMPEAARRAAKLAASEQATPGETTQILDSRPASSMPAGRQDRMLR
jgi:hypothetical protein